MIDLPKNPKAEDLLPGIAALEERVASLEAALAEHIGGASRRQREIEQLRAETQRARWAMRTGRKV